MKQPEKFDISNLPEKLQLNWAVLLCLRTDAGVEFSYAHAYALTGDTCAPGWVEAFREGSRLWQAKNPMDPMWERGDWPEGANDFLGNGAIEEARKLRAAGRVTDNYFRWNRS